MGTQAVVLGFNFNNDSILRHLLLDQDNFLDSADNEVAAWVIRALLRHACKLLMVHLREPAV